VVSVDIERYCETARYNSEMKYAARVPA